MIQRLRYKDYKLLSLGPIEKGRLLVEPGTVKEFGSLKDLVPEMLQCEVLDWWKINMGYMERQDEALD